MADNEKKPTSGVGVRTTEVEASLGDDHNGLSIIMDNAGGSEVRHEDAGRHTVDVGSKSQAAPEDDAAREQVEGEGTEGDDNQEQDNGSGDETAAELPGWDADKPEAVEAYTKRFTKDDGAALNLDALSQHWWSSVKDGKLDSGTLGDGTYAFLEAKFGLSKDQVKEIEAGQVSQRKAEGSARVKAAGGPDALRKAVEWGAKGGYTPEQRKAFNAAFNGRDQTHAIEAVELLMARFEKATKTTVRPKNNSTANANGDSGGKANPNVFHSKDEWQKAVTEAGRDPVKRQAVSDKFRRSPGAKSW